MCASDDVPHEAASPAPAPVRVPAGRAFARGLMRRCPHCGRGRLFDDWYQLRERCEFCELVFEPDPGATWGFTYVGAAAVTGLYGFTLFIIHYPRNTFERVIFFALALALMIGTIPRRKGAALALDYLSRVHLGGADETLPPEDRAPNRKEI